MNGGGQPHQNGLTRALVNVPGMRAAALYENDKNSEIRQSRKKVPGISYETNSLDKPN